MWKNSLKNVESDIKILYETVLDSLQRKGTNFLNKPRINKNIVTKTPSITTTRLLCYRKLCVCFGLTRPSSG